jgi:hypothetical protein
MDKYMKQSQKVRIQYSSKYANVSNAWKKWQGEMKGLKKMNTVAVKQAQEALFEQWAKNGEFEGLVDSIAAIYRKAEPVMFAKDYYNETFKACELINYAPDACDIAGTDEILGSFIDTVGTRVKAREFFKDYDVRIDKEIFAAMMAEFDRNIPQKDQPEYFKTQMRKYGDAKTWADSLYAQSRFTSLESVCSLTDFVHKDPAIELFCRMDDWRMELDSKISSSKINMIYCTSHYFYNFHAYMVLHKKKNNNQPEEKKEQHDQKQSYRK